MLWSLNVVSFTSLAVAWGFVVLRGVHVLIHTGSNVVAVRKKVFMFATVLLVVLSVLVLNGMLLAS